MTNTDRSTITKNVCKKYLSPFKIVSAQANIRNTLFDRKSPWYPEVSWILLINVKNMWVKKYPFVWEVCHHRPELEIFSLTRSLHNHKSGFFQCCALINSFLFLKKTAPHYCVITGQNLKQDLWIEVLRPQSTLFRETKKTKQFFHRS